MLFQGAPDGMWLVHVLAATGLARTAADLQLFVIPGEESGVRLVVNEIPYTGTARRPAQYCTGTITVPNPIAPLAPDAAHRAPLPTFVLADKLAYCRFSYYTPPSPDCSDPPVWRPHWAAKDGRWQYASRWPPRRPTLRDCSPYRHRAVAHPARPEKVYTDN